MIVLVLRPPPLFLEEYVDLGSKERIQQYDESYCGAYCLYMIYLIDRGFRITIALNILFNQCKYPGIYNECFCLSCDVKDKDKDKDKDNDKDKNKDTDNDNVIGNVNDNVNDNDNDNINDNDLRSSFAINENQGTCYVDDNDLRSSFANPRSGWGTKDFVPYTDQGTCLANHEQSSFADIDNFICLFDEKHGEEWTKSHQRGKPINKKCLSNNIRKAVQQSCLVNHERSSFASSPISVNINEDLKSWLDDDNIITEATLPENFRYIISGPSECGKTFLLKKLILARIYFDKLYIIGPTGDQYEGVESKAEIEFIKVIKD